MKTPLDVNNASALARRCTGFESWRGLRHAVLAAIGAFALSACSTSLTNSAPAKVYDPGKGQVNLNTSINVKPDIVVSLLDSGKAAQNEVGEAENDPNQKISEEQLRTWLDTMIQWGMFLPAPQTEIVARVGVADVLEGLDIGFRYGGGYKLDAKLQFWESPDGTQAASFSAGWGKQSIETPKWVKYITLTEWSRQNIDLQLLYGVEVEDYFKAYVGPRTMFSFVSASSVIPEWLRIAVPSDIEPYLIDKFMENELLTYFGVTSGMMLGYKYVFLTAELNMFYLNFEPSVLNSKRDYSGVIIAPNLGLTGMW